MEQHSPDLWATGINSDVNAGVSVFPHVEKCQQENSADKLEDHVKLAISVLNKLQGPLSNARDNKDASRFLKPVEKLRSPEQAVRTLISVVGNTGGLPH